MQAPKHSRHDLRALVTSEVEGPVRVLLADDHPDMQVQLRSILEEAGCEVEVVGDGVAALECIDRAAPDLLLADVVMPGMDGLDLVRRIRGLGYDFPIVLISGRAGREAVAEALERGADDYVVKPFDPRELVARVRTHVRLTRARRGSVAAHRLVEALEEDRVRIARELHDEIGQTLTGVKLVLATVAGDQSAGASDKLARCQDLIDETIAQIQAICRELRPTVLESLGLAEALRTFAARMVGSTTVKLSWDARGLPPRLPSFVEMTCYRIGQEAITNAVRHASATSLEVRLVGGQGRLLLEVRDNGLGFAVHDAWRDPDKALGLIGMRERAEQLGGSLQVQSELGTGTVVEARLPYGGALQAPGRTRSSFQTAD